MPQGLYLYCLARFDRLPPSPLLGRGLDGQNSLAVATYQDLAAVWSPVPVEDFCGPEAEERLRDLTWIGPRAIRHQEVVAGVMRHSPVLPVRFGTIFSSSANLEKVLQRHYDTIAGFLERLTGREEWAVKGLVDKARAKCELLSLHLARHGDRLTALTPGKRYFEEQRLRAQAERELNPRLRGMLGQTLEELRGHALDFCERPLRSQGDGDDGEEMLVNWAFLVDRNRVAALRAGIDAANARHERYGLVLAPTGPWPPYSFCPSLVAEPDP